ncbi:hypothetical protein CEXT_92421 [Caerostris extrusa]|uniref:Uncharacterized protein n=1 Tax=Caerostris extrusa TaxID=172846 RepID=A0AAV4REH1_CAEEX|nr:hypothetical protein CEXT_92421 [Caerostris extrusa]
MIPFRRTCDNSSAFACRIPPTSLIVIARITEQPQSPNSSRIWRIHIVRKKNILKYGVLVVFSDNFIRFCLDSSISSKRMSPSRGQLSMLL